MTVLKAVLVVAIIFTSMGSWACSSSQAVPESSLESPLAYLTTNQDWVEGLYAGEVDLEDVDTVFGYVFGQLPDQVDVYPSENYYYYILWVDGRQIWGNIRLAAGHRDRGELSFAYFEFDEFPSIPKDPGFTRSKMYEEEDGVVIEKIDDFTYVVRYQDKAVTFNLLRIPQEPPSLFSLARDEVSIERTFDESGYQFFLIFNEAKDYFLWVLNEESGVRDVLEPVGDEGEIVVGRRSHFAFWVDEAHNDRKILFAVRQLSVRRNDYYDGPFDQLADNYAEEVGISEYMQTAFPALRGRIDEFGYYTDTDRPMRVAITPYTTYYTETELKQFVARAKASGDPYEYISRRGAAGPRTTGGQSDES